LSHRLRMAQAAQVKLRLGAALGHSFSAGGTSLPAFPSPARFVDLAEVPFGVAPPPAPVPFSR
jgi:hypothetical protein